MKAVQIKSYGDPLEVLEVVDVSEPESPGANEALLGIEIATLNKHDLLFIGNALGSGPALRLVGDGSVRLGVDAIGGVATATLVQALSPGGVLVAYAVASGEPMSVKALQPIFKQLQVQGFFLGFFDYEKKVLPAMRAAAPLVASGALHVPVAAIYPLSRIREAVAHLLRGGKILLEVQKLN
jgi:NADPH:quinone reductase-like Zn-dependent oxidoreductase